MAHPGGSHSVQPVASSSSSGASLATVHEHGPLHVTRSVARRVGYRISTPKSNSTIGRSASRNNLANGTSDLTKPTIASMSRQRTLNTSAAAAAVKAGATSLSARRKSVLGEANNVTISSSASSRSLSSVSTPHRKVGRVEASQMTGMGIIRVGPAVQAQRSPKKVLSTGSAAMRHDSGPTKDPYSLAFVPPKFDQLAARQMDENEQQRVGSTFTPRSYSVSPDKRPILPMPTVVLASVEEAQGLPCRPRASPGPFDLTSPKKIGTMSPNKELAQSPARRRLFGAGENVGFSMPLELSPPIKREATKDHDAMDVDRVQIPPSSPVPNAQTPRTLVGGSRRKFSAASDESEDEIDWLSPRKKPRPSDPTPQVTMSASPAQLGLPVPVSPGQIRSPPKKMSSSSESTVTSSTPRSVSPSFGAPRSIPFTSTSTYASNSTLATPKPTPTSVPMMRSPGIRFPPSPFSSKLPTTTAGSVATASAATPARPLLATPARSLLATPKPMTMPSLVLPDTIDPQLLTARSPAPALTCPPRPPPSTSSLAPQFAPRYAPSPAHTRSYLQRKQRLQSVQAQPHGQTYLATPSGIPRAVPSPSKPTITFSASPAPAPLFAEELLTVDPASLTAPSEVDEQGDFSMSSTSTSACDTSSLSSSGNHSMSEETSKRLANLQNMLSRLSMPRLMTEGATNRPVAGGARAPPSNLADLKARRERTKNLTAQFREEYTVPIAPADDSASQRLALRASVPPSAKENASLGMGPPPPRRRNSTATRGANGIIDTSSRGAPLLATTSAPSVMTGSTSTTGAATKGSRRVSGGPAPSSASTATIAAAVGEGEMCAKPKSDVLHGVVAFVDVRTLEGDDAGMIFTDMLKSMGARVTTRHTLSLTHIVFKSGRPGTLQRYRTHADPKPHLVGISWVVRCAELNQHVDEAPFLVEAGKEELFQKKRRSMEPKALNALNAPPGVVLAASTDPGLRATIAASLERARRKSLQFAPKVGSPLAKRVFVMPVEEREEEEEEGTDKL